MKLQGYRPSSRQTLQYPSHPNRRNTILDQWLRWFFTGDYFAVDETVLWNTVSVSIPKTVAAAKEAKRKYEHDGTDGAGGGASGGPPL